MGIDDGVGFASALRAGGLTPLRIYYDTEFLEDGKTIELISIGMVAENGREYYAVNLDAPWDRITRDEWLAANVMPSLPIAADGKLDASHGDCKPKTQIADEVAAFLLAAPSIELWAWYGAYDFVALAQLFGRLIDIPRGIPMWTNDLRQELARLGDPPLPEQPEGLHNALADARHLKARAEHLRASAEERSDEAPNASDLGSVETQKGNTE